MIKDNRCTLELTTEQLAQIKDADRLYQWFNDNEKWDDLTDNELRDVLRMQNSYYLDRDTNFNIYLNYLYANITAYDLSEVLECRTFSVSLVENKFGSLSDFSTHIHNLYQWAINELTLEEWPIQLIYKVLKDKQSGDNMYQCNIDIMDLEERLFELMR